MYCIRFSYDKKHHWFGWFLQGTFLISPDVPGSRRRYSKPSKSVVPSGGPNRLSTRSSLLVTPFLTLQPFPQDSANSSATHTWLSNIMVFVVWFLLQETLLFDVSNWICFKIGCLNSENLPPPPVQPIQRSWWLLMYSVEISTLITAPLVRQALHFLVSASPDKEQECSWSLWVIAVYDYILNYDWLLLGKT